MRQSIRQSWFFGQVPIAPNSGWGVSKKHPMHPHFFRQLWRNNLSSQHVNVQYENQQWTQDIMTLKTLKKKTKRYKTLQIPAKIAPTTRLQIQIRNLHFEDKSLKVALKNLSGWNARPKKVITPPHTPPPPYTRTHIHKEHMVRTSLRHCLFYGKPLRPNML